MGLIDGLFGRRRIRAARRLGVFMAVCLGVSLLLIVLGSAIGQGLISLVGWVLFAAALMPLFFLPDVIFSWLGGWLRAGARAAAAAAHGLSFSRDDPFELDRVGFAGLGEGGAENVAWGSAGGVPVLWFDWVRGLTGRKGTFACGAIDLLADCPPLVLGREGSDLDLGGLPKVDLEAVEFNRAFVVACADRRFATTFCDSALMAWLIDSWPPQVPVEARGRYVVCWIRKPRRSGRWVFGLIAIFMGGGQEPELESILQTTVALGQHLPKVIASVYPARAPAPGWSMGPPNA